MLLCLKKINSLASKEQVFFFFLSQERFCSEKGGSNNMTFVCERKTLVWPLCESLIGLFSATPSRLYYLRRIDLSEVNL